MRDPDDVLLAMPPGEIRILVLGDSRVVAELFEPVHVALERRRAKRDAES